MRASPRVTDYGGKLRNGDVARSHRENGSVLVQHGNHELRSESAGAASMERGYEVGALHFDSRDRLVVVEAGRDTSVSKLLWAARVPEKGARKASRSRWFIPHRQLQSICHFEAVLREVRKHAHDDDGATSCAEYVCGPKDKPSFSQASSSRKIFATLVLVRHLQLIFDFQKAGVRDKHLPFSTDTDTTKLRSFHAGERLTLDFFGDTDDPLVVDCISKMEWSVHVPYISRDAERNRPCDYQLDAETIMPWTDFPTKVTNGGFGEVRRIKIHPDHHGFSHQLFALKTFYRNVETDKIDFEREMRAFRKMPEETHLVELCATFASEGDYRLLFPWADGGSLKTLWQRRPSSLLLPDTSSSHKTKSTELMGTTAEFTNWLGSQAYGLMCGLKTIHELPQPTGPPYEPEHDKLYGIHGDLKPENILHFSQETDVHRLGTLKIADFGIMKFHSLNTRTTPNEDWTGPMSPTYRAPEHDKRVKEMISRKVDIWAMGCVFSEMLTWALMGGEAVDRYALARLRERTRLNDPQGWTEDNFFCRVSGSEIGDEPNFDTHIVKPSVTEWLARLIRRSLLSEQDESKTFITEFLTFIQDSMLTTVREERASCEEVIDFIQSRLDMPATEAYWTCNWGSDMATPQGTRTSNTRVHFSQTQEEADR